MVKSKTENAFKPRTTVEEEVDGDKAKIYFQTKLPPENQFPCVLSVMSRYTEVSKRIQGFLNRKELRKLVKRTQFGNLIMASEHHYNSNMVLWYLMSKQVDYWPGSEELWFVIRGRPLRFSILEYCLLTGLDCSAIDSSLKIRPSKFLKEHFLGKKIIYIDDLEQKMDMMIKDRGSRSKRVNIEKMKIAALYFAVGVLGSRKVRRPKVLEEWLSLIDDWDAFTNYPWGRIAYQESISGLNKKDLNEKYDDVLRKKKDHGTYDVSGFVYPLIILAYECWPSVGQQFARKNSVEGLPIPRMCHWIMNHHSKSSAPGWQEVVDAFNNAPMDDVRCWLTPSDIERGSKHFATIENFEGNKDDVVAQRILDHLRGERAVYCVNNHLGEASERASPSRERIGSDVASPHEDSHSHVPPTHEPIQTQEHIRLPQTTILERMDKLDEEVGSLRAEIRALHSIVVEGFKTLRQTREQDWSYDTSVQREANIVSNVRDMQFDTPVFGRTPNEAEMGNETIEMGNETIEKTVIATENMVIETEETPEAEKTTTPEAEKGREMMNEAEKTTTPETEKGREMTPEPEVVRYKRLRKREQPEREKKRSKQLTSPYVPLPESTPPCSKPRLNNLQHHIDSKLLNWDVVSAELERMSETHERVGIVQAYDKKFFKDLSTPKEWVTEAHINEVLQGFMAMQECFVFPMERVAFMNTNFAQVVKFESAKPRRWDMESFRSSLQEKSMIRRHSIGTKRRLP